MTVSRRWIVPLALIAAACTDGPVSPPPPVQISCDNPSSVALAPGDFTVIDPAASGSCIRLPAADANGAEHIYVALSAAGQETGTGVSTSYRLAGAAAGALTAAAAPTLAGAAAELPGGSLDRSPLTLAMNPTPHESCSFAGS